MRAGTAEIKSAPGGAVIGIAEHRSCRKQLVERERPVKDIPAGQAEVAFEIEGRQDFAGEDALLEIRGVPVDCFDDHVCRGFPLIVPAAAAGQRRVEVLAEQTRDVLSWWRETRIDSARDQHLDDGL